MPKRLDKAAAVLFAAWAAFILWKAYSGSGPILRQGLEFLALRPWVGAPRAAPILEVIGAHALAIGALSTIALAAFGWGSLLLSKTCKFPIGRLERFLLAQGLGLGALALVELAILAAGIRPILATLGPLGVGLALAARQMLRRTGEPLPRRNSGKPPSLPTLDSLEWALLLLTAYAALLHLVGALAPETFHDSLVYHLGAPQLYLIRGGLVPLEGILHSNFPQNMEMLYAIALILRGEPPAKLLHLWMMLLTLLALYGLGRTASSRRTGLLAAALFAAIPVAALAAWQTGVELGAAFWQFMGVWTLIRAVFALPVPGGNAVSGAPSRGKPPAGASAPGNAVSWMILSGVFHGLAMGTKYTVIWSAAASGAALGVWLLRRRDLSPRLRWSLGAVWAGAAALLVAPWLFKNLSFTGNPVYPFLEPWSHGGASGVDLEGFKASARGHYWYGGLLDWRTWVLTPWRLFIEGRSSFSFIGPVFLAFLPLTLFAAESPFPFGWVLAVFGASYLGWSAQSSMIRLLIPALPLFCLYTAQSLDRLGKRWGGWLPWTAVLVVLWNVSWNAAMLNEKEVPSVVFGYETQPAYLSRPHHGYPVPFSQLAWYAARLPESSRILVLGDERRYPIPRDTLTFTSFDRNFFLEALAAAGSTEGLREALARKGVTHILFTAPEAERLLGAKLGALPADRIELLAAFWRDRLEELERDRHGGTLYRLRDAGERTAVPPGVRPSPPPIVELALRRR